MDTFKELRFKQHAQCFTSLLPPAFNFLNSSSQSLIISHFVYLPFLAVGCRDLLIWAAVFLRGRITKCWNLLPLSDKSSISMRGDLWDGGKKKKKGGGGWSVGLQLLETDTQGEGFHSQPKASLRHSPFRRKGGHTALYFAVSMLLSSPPLSD